MANIVKIKNSNVVGRVPSSLETGELAINISDGKLFFKNANNQIDSFNSNAVVHQNFAEATYFPQANNTINSTNIDSYQKINDNIN